MEEAPKKRKRRTKAEIEAAKAAAPVVPAVVPAPVVIPQAVKAVFEAQPEIKTAYLSPDGEWFFHESQATRNFGPGNYKTINRP